MSAPPAGPPGIPPPPPHPGQTFLPPVPPPWTEHRAPAGQLYWFNPQTNVSTYTRPMPPPPPPGFNPQQYAPPMRFNGPPPAAAPAPEKKEKKEKPKEKLPIEGTDWIKVTTNKGNVFYTNKTSKESVWTVPEEVKAVLAELESSKKRKASEEGEGEEESAQEADTSKIEVEVEGAEGAQPLAAVDKEDKEIIVEPKKKKAKKAKVVREIEELEQDEDWQRQVAEEMAKEVAEAEAKAEEEKAAASAPAAPVDLSALPQRPEGDAQTRAPRIDVSDEEGAAMFRAMLAEKDIAPMAPWDMELPKFINDPRYLAVKQLKTRHDLFDEFCKEKIREQRAAKKKAQEAGGGKADPLAAYRALLLTAVTSTRTHFSDFKRAHAKDPRFRDFGKTEGEKEKVFKGWLRELGERKRAEAEKAEQRFVEMLKADKDIKEGDQWAEVKTRHVSDPRYSAVNSSSLRESLFKKHVAALASGDVSTANGSSAPAAVSKEERAARAAASLKEREEKVRLEQERVARSAQAARGAMGREEGEREWGTLLVDLVRDHDARWDDVLPTLSRDARFTSSSLPSHEQRRLFDAHLRNLYTKRLNLVEGLFLANSPSLTTPFTTILPTITENPHVKSLVGTDYDRLEGLFDSWSRKRVEKARADFEQMMKESAILEHWGRLQKKEDTEGDKKLAIGQDGEEDDEDEGDDVPTLTEMAKQVDLKAIHAVLKHDKRYLIFDHDPERRNQWIEDYLRNLAAPKSTVHQKE